jgi:hypothetical protein
VVGSIWPMGTRDDRSTVRWQAPTAARSPVRPQGVMEEAKVVPRFVERY